MTARLYRSDDGAIINPSRAPDHGFIDTGTGQIDVPKLGVQSDIYIPDPQSDTSIPSPSSDLLGVRFTTTQDQEIITLDFAGSIKTPGLLLGGEIELDTDRSLLTASQVYMPAGTGIPSLGGDVGLAYTINNDPTAHVTATLDPSYPLPAGLSLPTFGEDDNDGRFVILDNIYGGQSLRLTMSLSVLDPVIDYLVASGAPTAKSWRGVADGRMYAAVTTYFGAGGKPADSGTIDYLGGKSPTAIDVASGKVLTGLKLDAAAASGSSPKSSSTAAADLFGTHAEVVGGNLVVNMDVDGLAAGANLFDFYIDTDRSTKTGLVERDIDDAGRTPLGADYDLRIRDVGFPADPTKPGVPSYDILLLHHTTEGYFGAHDVTGPQLGWLHLNPSLTAASPGFLAVTIPLPFLGSLGSTVGLLVSSGIVDQRPKPDNEGDKPDLKYGSTEPLVVPVPYAPKAVADSYAADAGSKLSVGAAAGVLANDTDNSTSALTAHLVASPGHGTISLNADGSFDYTPNVGFFGADGFSYRAISGQFHSSRASVSITVRRLAPPPTPSGLSFALAADKAALGDTIKIAGNGEAGDRVSLFDRTSVVGAATVAASGGWSITTPKPLAIGAHTLRASEVDIAGNKSKATAAQNLSLLRAAPNQAVFVGTAGKDQLTGGAGNDQFKFSAANLAAIDIVKGGLGADRLVITAAGVAHASGVGGVETYVLANGGANGLTLAKANFAGVTGAVITVDGGAKGNTVSAAAVSGADRLVAGGGAGKDAFTGGAGNDVFRFTAAALASTDIVRGGGGNDQLVMTTAGTVRAGKVSGVETYVLAGGGPNALTVAAGNFVGVTGAAITVRDGAGGNTIDAASLPAADRIVVHAGSGLDRLTGGAGGDVLYAGGRTAMTGKAGRNEFVFAAPGANTIADFAASATNRIAFGNAGFKLGLAGASATPKPVPARLFTKNATGAFTSRTERFAYDTANGKLFYSAA
ncbi:MAG TPA: Ig-like domain-containing protein, partial [Stellaceae bacterium]